MFPFVPRQSVVPFILCLCIVKPDICETVIDTLWIDFRFSLTPLYLLLMITRFWLLFCLTLVFITACTFAFSDYLAFDRTNKRQRFCLSLVCVWFQSRTVTHCHFNHFRIGSPEFSEMQIFSSIFFSIENVSGETNIFVSTAYLAAAW